MKNIRLNGKVNPKVQDKVSRIAETENNITQGMIIEIALNWLFKELETKPLTVLYAEYLKETATGGVIYE